MLNHTYYNGYSAINVTVEDGAEWLVTGDSLITYLSVADGALVYGVLTENEDGSLSIAEGTDPIPAGEYGTYVEANVAASAGMGNVGGSAEPTGINPGGSGSDEASAEPSAEPSAEAAGSVEDAYKEYLHEWLIAEDEVNDTMTEEIRENEFMPLIWAGDYETFPAEMLWNGMLENGSPMTFDEFAAQYDGAAAPAAGAADEDGYKAYMKEWVAANPAVQANIDEFNAAIDAGAYGDFPLEMCYTDQWFGFAAMTLDEFIAAGGAYEIPAFDPNLAPD